MTTNIGRTDDEQLIINVRKMIEKIENGEWTKEELIQNRNREIAHLSHQPADKENLRRIEYIKKELITLHIMEVNNEQH